MRLSEVESVVVITTQDQVGTTLAARPDAPGAYEQGGDGRTSLLVNHVSAGLKQV